MPEPYTVDEVLCFAISDSINSFIRDTLVGRGIVDEERIEAFDEVINEGIRAIVDRAIRGWKMHLSAAKFDEATGAGG
jgi:hypothetical protein